MSRARVKEGGRCRRNGNARSRIGRRVLQIGAQPEQPEREKCADCYEIPEQWHGTALRCDAHPSLIPYANPTLRRSEMKALRLEHDPEK